MRSQTSNGERGSATVIAILIMGLLTVFVSLSMSRASNEAMLMGNDASEGRAFNAAQASLETMTRNFNKIYDVRLAPIPSDLTAIQTAAVPGFTNYGFNQVITATQAPSQVVISGGAFQGLYATRDAWRLDTLLVLRVGAHHKDERARDDRRRAADAGEIERPLHALGLAPLAGQIFFRRSAIEFRPAPLLPIAGKGGGREQDE